MVQRAIVSEFHKIAAEEIVERVERIVRNPA